MYDFYGLQGWITIVIVALPFVSSRIHAPGFARGQIN